MNKTESYFHNLKNDLINYNEGWIDKIKAFKAAVTDYSPYDIKNDPNSSFYAGKNNKNYLNGHAFYNGNLFRYDDFGNYNYGVAAKAFGLSMTFAEFAAGINQLSKIRQVPIGGPSTYFDDPKDNYMIKEGYYNFYDPRPWKGSFGVYHP